MQRVCFNENKIVTLFVITFILFVCFIVVLLYYIINGNQQPIIIKQTEPINNNNPILNTMEITNEISNELDQEDRDIMMYDYSTAFGTFIQPVRRVPRYELPPLHLKRMIDFPTR